jgi:hypothetical protein
MLFLLACKGPSASKKSLDTPGCAGTAAGHACLTLVFSVALETRKHAAGDLNGPFGWGLYKGGDVTILGPGSNAQMYGTPWPPAPGDLPVVDFSADGATYSVTLADIDAREYQVLASLDDNANFQDDHGDVMTFPGDPFEATANEHTVFDATLDYLD